MVHQTRAPGHHLDDVVLFPEKVARGGNAVTAQIVQSASTRLGDVPEMCAMGAAVRFARPHPNHPAYTAVLDGLPGLDHARRKHFRFGVTVKRARLYGC